MNISKKTFIVFTALLLVTTQTALADFPDVPQTNEHYIAVQYFAPLGIFSSYQDGNFHPEEYFSFADGVKWILVQSYIPAANNVTTDVFSDVGPSDPDADYLEKAKDMGLIQGDADNNVHPNETMTRAKFVKILLKAKGFNETNWQNKDLYKDVPASAWFNPYMNFAGTNGIIFPDENGYLYPSQLMSRGEAAEAFYVTELMRNRLNLQFLKNQEDAQIIQTKIYFNNDDFASADRASAFADTLGQEIFRLSSTNNLIVGKAKIGRAYRNLIRAYVSKKRNKSDEAKAFADTAITKSNEAVSSDVTEIVDADNVINLANQFEN